MSIGMVARPGSRRRVLKTIIWIGAAAAYYLETTVRSGDVIGISSWSSTLLAMVDAMHQFNKIKDTRVVQILGSVGNPAAEVHASNLLKRMASLLNGEAI